jgi:hypothetical protein
MRLSRRLRLLGYETRTSSEDSESRIAPPWLFSFCPFFALGKDGLVHMLVGPGDRASGLRELRDFTAGAKRLVIVDRYFFAADRSDAEQYASELRKTARFDEVQDIHVVHDDRCVTKAVLSAVKATAKASGVRPTLRSTDKVHFEVLVSAQTERLN